MQNYKLSVKLHLALHTVCQIIQLNGKVFAFHLKKLHRAEKIYTGAACGACDKYQVCAYDDDDDVDDDDRRIIICM